MDGERVFWWLVLVAIVVTLVILGIGGIFDNHVKQECKTLGYDSGYVVGTYGGAEMCTMWEVCTGETVLLSEVK